MCRPPSTLLAATAVVLTALAVTAPAPARAIGASAGAPATLRVLDPRERGVALTDFGDDTADLVAHHLAHAADLDLGVILSSSLYALDGPTFIVDVVSIHPRFHDAYPLPTAPWPGLGVRPGDRPPGGVGLTRVRVVTAAPAAYSAVVSHAVLGRAALGVMDLSLRVSISDTLAIVEDPKLDFRRVYPLGVGALDTIRLPGALSSVTPTTRYGRLDRLTSWAVMTFPKHFKDLPYLPLNIARLRQRDDGARELSWHPTWIAFHIWQPSRFARGFLSHGCVRMRDADLAELSAFVFGREAPVPVVIVAEALTDVRHPHWKLTDRYYQLKNIGTAKAPKTWTINKVWVTEYMHEVPLPRVDRLVGITIDPPNLAREDVGPPLIAQP